ncbi:MAG: hypothetical protein ABUS57_04400 [Pseudomonadota bacterium]
MSRASLSGAWSGAYRYPRDAFPETVFEARIEEGEAGFEGVTSEPNIIRQGRESVLTATISGLRIGRDVAFTKYMDGSGGMKHAIQYRGLADADLTRIEGAWVIPGDWSGTFFMTRVDDGENIAQSAKAEETVSNSR